MCMCVCVCVCKLWTKQFLTFESFSKNRAKPLTGLSDLSTSQEQYAALDAWCTLQVYKQLHAQRTKQWIRRESTTRIASLYTVQGIEARRTQSSSEVIVMAAIISVTRLSSFSSLRRQLLLSVRQAKTTVDKLWMFERAKGLCIATVYSQ